MYWKLKEEALDRNLWITRFGTSMELSQDRVRDDDEHKTVVIKGQFGLQFRASWVLC